MMDTAVTSFANVRAFDQFGEAEIAEALAALDTHGLDGSKVKRLLRTESGQWLMTVRVPAVATLAPEHLDRPWADAFALTWSPATKTLSEAAAMLAGGCEKELERRESISADFREQSEAEDRERRRVADAAESTRVREAEEARRKHNADVWERLAPWAKLAYSLALVHEDHGQAEIATAIRGIAAQGGGYAANHPGPAFPGRRWR